MSEQQMKRQPSLVVEIKAKVFQSLVRYPSVKITHEKWSTGGAVNVEWIDGPTEAAIDKLVFPLKSTTSIIISTTRLFSPHFLEHIALAYCKAKKCGMPQLRYHTDGTATIDRFADRMLAGEILAACATIDENDLADVAFRPLQDGRVVQTSLILKRDYSENVSDRYAVIGRQGYAKSSGPHVWFDIYDVEQRHGKHRVKIIPNTGRGFFFHSTDEAITALRQLLTTGNIEPLYSNGQWHY